MIEQILLFFIGFSASYALLKHTFKKKLEEKYSLIRFKTKNEILANEALFADKKRELELLNEQIREVSAKKYATEKKNVADQHLYKSEIIEEYEFQKRLNSKPASTEDGNGGNDTSTDTQAKKKDDENILADFPSHLL